MSLGPSVLTTRSLPTYDSLFPLSSGLSSWTTLPGHPDSLPLANSTLNPIKAMKALPLRYVTGPDGKDAIHVHFPNGSYTLNSDPQGGISFYSHGPKDHDLTIAKEATLGYAVYFPEGFEFVKGGKLPGFFGGNSDDESYSCSGGRKDIACFSTRLMWRTNGAGEIYAYFPPYDVPGFESNRALCEPAENRCDATYGISIGRGNFKFERGRWTTVAQRVRLNDPGQANGEVELFVDGKSKIRAEGIIIREGEEGRIRGIQVQSFFGGSTVDWASPKDQDIYFADFSVAVTQGFDETDNQKWRRDLETRE
ncbi:alginate lyase [Coprinopsis cinerea AmutBmut pab1-1]|nr:alginate lyase [Coprinopsis cinerea AmutBmut pab1-1]